MCVCVCVCLSVRLYVCMYVCMYVCLFFNFYLTTWICGISILCRSLSLRIKIIFSLRHYSLLCFRLFISSSQYFFLLRLVPLYLLLFYKYYYKHSYCSHIYYYCAYNNICKIVVSIKAPVLIKKLL